MGSKQIAHRLSKFLAAALALSGCASLPPPSVGESLDPGTGTTVTVVPTPVELLAELQRSDPSASFAYLAPFETNRMGERTLYLWVATPQAARPAPQFRVLCDGQPLSLSRHEGALREIGLSQPPYTAPVPWSDQWYFQLPEEALRCLGNARHVALEMAAGNESILFGADAPALAPLTRFSGQVLSQSNP